MKFISRKNDVPIRLNIDGLDIETQKGKSILQASLDAGVYIPHLCHHPDLSPIGACRLCVVEVNGNEELLTSCTTPASSGMKIRTKTKAVEHMRRLAMELMLAGHAADCGTCNKYLNCELQSVKQYLGIDNIRVKRRSKPFPYDAANPLFVHDATRCIVCGRCARACNELRGVGVLFYKKKGKETYLGTASGLPLADSGCRFCGACVEVCPTGALQDKEEILRGKSRKAALVPCRYNCPAEMDVPRYIRFIRENNYSAAAAVIREKVPFPKILGYICDRPCETVCRRSAVNESVSIRELKRYAVEHDVDNLWEKNSDHKPATDKKVAIIGSGPAGLTAAYYLSRQGHGITVLESMPHAGGMMRYGIPEYRLPRNIIDSEINDIKKMGIEIRTNTYIDSIEKLFNSGYTALLVAIGTVKGKKLSIPGADNEQVLIGIDFMRNFNLGGKADIGKKVLVLGGGKVALDCARTALRGDVESVGIFCPEHRMDMPVAGEEIELVEKEGISIHPSKMPARILCKNGKLTGVEFHDVESFSFDEYKNPQFQVIENSQSVIETDTVIFAVGQRPDIPAAFGLNTSPGDLIEIDPCTFNTNIEGVFAAGDAVIGSASVIRAIASGRKAAIAIDNFLEGSGNIDEILAPHRELPKWLGPGENFAFMNRCADSRIPLDDQLKRFGKVVYEMDEEAAVYEAKRCLQCDLRLKITTIKFWGSY